MSNNQCSKCGAQLKGLENYCTQCGARYSRKTVPRGTLISLIVLFLLICIYSIGSIYFKNNKPSARHKTSYIKSPPISNSYDQTTTPEKTNIDYPNSQNAFHFDNMDYSKQYEEGKNEIQKSEAYNNCNIWRKRYLSENGNQIRNWAGIILNISTNQGGDVAWITIRAKSNDFTIDYETSNNGFSDIGIGSQIKKGSAVYRQIWELTEGDAVLFSGEFIKDEKRGIKEISMTEYGCINNPEFIVRFSEVKRFY